MNDLTPIVFSAVASGAVSTFCTVIALRVHIQYLREGLKRIESSVTRAHGRIDTLEGRR